MNRIKKIFLSILFAAGTMMFWPLNAMAQGDIVPISQEFLYSIVLILIGFIIVVLIVVIFSLQSTRKALMIEETKRLEEKGIEVEKKPGWWSVLIAKLTRSVPVEQEKDVMLDHNYDGIRELDNHLPPWWTWLFIITVVFGIVYLMVFHVFKVAPLQTEEYEIAMAEAASAAMARQTELVASGEAFDESAIEFSDDPRVLANGETIFKRQCSPCHREDGGGGIGPNLTDEYWLHGGSIANLYNTIKVGVPDKGMISWEPVLSPEQIRDVASYILTFGGTNPENAKAPQGEIYEAEPTEPAAPLEATDSTGSAEVTM